MTNNNSVTTLAAFQNKKHMENLYKEKIFNLLESQDEAITLKKLKYKNNTYMNANGRRGSSVGSRDILLMSL